MSFGPVTNVEIRRPEWGEKCLHAVEGRAGRLQLEENVSFYGLLNVRNESKLHQIQRVYRDEKKKCP
jgi:hypothetical protein